MNLSLDLSTRVLLGATLLLQGAFLISAVYLKYSLVDIAWLEKDSELSVVAVEASRVAQEDMTFTSSFNINDYSEAPEEELSHGPAHSLPVIGDVQAEEQEEEISAPEIVRYRIRSGDTLTKIWAAQKAPYAGALAAAKALKSGGVSLKELRAGDLIELQISENGDITAFRKELRGGREVVLDGDSNGFSATVTEPEIQETKTLARGVIKNSFFDSAVRENVPLGVVDDFVDLFSGRVEFSRDMRAGDSFALKYMALHTGDGEFHDGEILAASLKNKGDLLVAVRYEDSKGKEHYYDMEGNPLGNFFLRYPVKFSRISSSFSRSRFHPVHKIRRPHNGVDFAAPTGTPIRAVADGIVKFAGYKGAAGKMIKIRHGSRYSTAYLHLSKIGRGLRNGSRVKRGQYIGAVGKTGTATGPHLHYSFYDYGRYVDPMKVKLPMMPTTKEKIPQNYLSEMINKLKDQHEQVQLALLANGRISG